MGLAFNHGLEFQEVTSGVRTVRTVRGSVIFLCGTAPKGDVNKPVVISGNLREAIDKFGKGVGTIPDALKGIFAQAGAVVVVMNVLNPATHKKTIASKAYTFDAKTEQLTLDDAYGASIVVKNTGDTVTYVLTTDYLVDTDTGVITRVTSGSITSGESVNVTQDIPDPTLVTDTDIIGTVDGTGNYTGLKGALGAESVVGFVPKIIIAPSYSASLVGTAPNFTGAPVAAEMISVASTLRGFAIIDGSNTTDADALGQRALFGEREGFLVDPWLTVLDDSGAEVSEPPSARVAGTVVSNDEKRGWHTSPSNQIINGVIGLGRPISAARAVTLNENEISTIIRDQGYRLYGNRTTSSDSKWAFLSHVRLNDILIASLQAAHNWAVDKNLTKTYFDDVTDGVNSYLATLQAQEIISGGNCWADPAKNTATEMDGGKAYFDIDYGRYGVAEHLEFSVSVNPDYTTKAIFG